ncbi:hypothetical protein [Methylomonas fluvii]|jgi:hypothetical protein|uniref:hypothetical protein n=1 Tax=Methylomonas fluvii TaxID=1854564 RepID=UPI001CE141AA|nr:hypothetical protein [Methylomonas fluvii]
MKFPFIRISQTFAAAVLLTACASHHPPVSELTQFTPGLGEIMAQSAVRHAKLWFAGRAQNWELAAYEIDELHEGFEDASKFHPTHKDIKQPIPELIARYMDQPLAELEQAIKDKNTQAFSERYDHLTASCNACHQATDFGFNKVIQPSFNPFANQSF